MRDWPDESYYNEAQEFDEVQKFQMLIQELSQLSQKYNLNSNIPNHLAYWERYANNYPTLFSPLRQSLSSHNQIYTIPLEVFSFMLNMLTPEQIPYLTLNNLLTEIRDYFTTLDQKKTHIDSEQQCNNLDISGMSLSEPPFPLGGSSSSPTPGSYS